MSDWKFLSSFLLDTSKSPCLEYDVILQPHLSALVWIDQRVEHVLHRCKRHHQERNHLKRTSLWPQVTQWGEKPSAKNISLDTKVAMRRETIWREHLYDLKWRHEERSHLKRTPLWPKVTPWGEKSSEENNYMASNDTTRRIGCSPEDQTHYRGRRAVCIRINRKLKKNLLLHYISWSWHIQCVSLSLFNHYPSSIFSSR